MDLVHELTSIQSVESARQPELICFYAARVLEVAVIDTAFKLELEQGRRNLHMRMVDLHDAGFMSEFERNAFVCLKRIGNDVRHVKRAIAHTDAQFAKWALIALLDWWAKCEAPPFWPGLRQDWIESLAPEPGLADAFSALCGRGSAEGEGFKLLQRPAEDWLAGAPVTDDLFALGVERLIDSGCNELALKQLQARKVVQGNTLRNRQRELMALAYSRTGQLDAALRVLKEIDDQNFEKPTEECAGIYGGVLKRLWLNTGEQAYLAQALQKYQLADPPGEAEDLYCGVNQAACLLWLGQADAAQALAKKLLGQLQRFERIPYPRRNLSPLADSPWRALTQAECHLMAKEFDQAKAIYQQIFSLEGQHGRLESAKVNLRRHLKALNLAANAPDYGV